MVASVIRSGEESCPPPRQDRQFWFSLWAPAKINLYLQVLGKRPDGYHELITILQAVGWYDRLDFAPAEAPGILLSCNNPSLPTDEGNLVVRAVCLLAERFGLRPSARLHLEKTIPVGAGLGGGSSDAAATLLGMARLWELDLEACTLEALAAELGSDVPFFLKGGRALATGRGEKTEFIGSHGGGVVVLVIPRAGLATREVYAGLKKALTSQGADAKVIMKRFRTNKTGELSKLLRNDLEASAFHLRPDLLELKERIHATVLAEGTLLAGSGSALYALVQDLAAAGALTDQLRETPGLDCRVVYTVGEGVVATWPEPRANLGGRLPTGFA